MEWQKQNNGYWIAQGNADLIVYHILFFLLSDILRHSIFVRSYCCKQYLWTFRLISLSGLAGSADKSGSQRKKILRKN